MPLLMLSNPKSNTMSDKERVDCHKNGEDKLERLLMLVVKVSLKDETTAREPYLGRAFLGTLCPMF